MHVEHPKRTLLFLDGFAFRRSASTSFSSDQLGSDVADICIHMNVSPWPSLNICHDQWTVARQATWQHFFT